MSAPSAFLLRATLARFSLRAALLALCAGVGVHAVRAANTIPVSDVSGNWMNVSWGSSINAPGNNSGENDAVYIRRNNVITIDRDVTPSALGYSGGINAVVVGDGFDGPARGMGTLIITGEGRLRVQRVNETLGNFSIVNAGRDRPNSVGFVMLDGVAQLAGATLNIGATTTNYDVAYLNTHTVPSSGSMRISENASATFTSLVLGTAASRNATNTAAGFPAATGSLEIVGPAASLAISGAVSFNSSGTLQLTATGDGLPLLAFAGSVTTEAGFTLNVALAGYDASALQGAQSVSLLTFKDAATATAFFSAATINLTGEDIANVSASVAAVGNAIKLTIARADDSGFTGAGVQISHQPSPSSLDILLGRDIYIADPAITVAPDGSYLIAHSIFGDGTDQANLITKVFRSIDKGATWTQVATMERLQRASFFTHDGVVYCLGTGRIPGNSSTHLVIRKSTDNGLTWTPGPLTTSDPGYLRTGGTGTPSTPVIYQGRVWMARSTLGLSGDLSKDLMTPAAWTVHNNAQSTPNAETRPAYRDTWPAYNDQTLELWSESQIVAAPHTGVVLMPKIEMKPVTKGTTTVPHFSHVPHISLQKIPTATSAVTIDPANTFVPLPGTQKKFGATYDPATQKFYVLTNTVLPAFETHEDAKHKGCYKPQLTRNTGTLYSSRDLVHWDLEKIFIHSDNVAHHAWQYFNFVFDAHDLLAFAPEVA